MAADGEPRRVPEPQLPRKRRSAAFRVFVSLFFLLVLGLVGVAVSALYGYREFNAPGPLAQSKIFEIERGLGTPEIADTLEQQGIISNARVFSIASLLSGSRGRLKAGEYEFPATATMRQVMDLLISGKSIVYKLTVPEGFTSEMALARILDNPVLTGEIDRDVAEGSIMPDTYVFKRGTTRKQILAQMQEAQTKLLDEVWTNRNPAIPLQTRDEALVLASIVEKETGQADERPIIASVFVNRLRKGMRLQSDPTIIYGIVGGKGRLDRRLTKTDITTPTPYNTYTIKGLPPGPIANPGRAALEAVTNPPETTYLYFVADGSGGHAFASTLAEHNRNVAKWRDLDGNAASVVAVAEEDATAQDSAAAEQAAAIDKQAVESQLEVPDATAADGADAAAAPQADLPVPGPDADAVNAAVPTQTATAADAARSTAATAATDPARTGTTAPAAASDDRGTADAADTATGNATADSGTATADPAPVAADTDAGATGTPQTVKPVPKPKAASPETSAKPPKPGSIVKRGNALVPIPKRKPKRPAATSG